MQQAKIVKIVITNIPPMHDFGTKPNLCIILTISLVATGGCIGKLSRYLRIHRKSSLPFDAFTADMLMDYRLFVQDEYQYVQRYTMLELKDRFTLMCAAFGEEQ